MVHVSASRSTFGLRSKSFALDGAAALGDQDCNVAGLRAALVFGRDDNDAPGFGVAALRFQSSLHGLGFYVDVEVSPTGINYTFDRSRESGGS